jgi:hypothetical protein
MSDLSPELQQLVLAGRTTCLPTDADCARVFEALEARLATGGGIGSDATTTTVTKSAVRALVAKAVGITVAGLALVVGGVGLVTTVVQKAGPELGVSKVAADSSVSPPPVSRLEGSGDESESATQVPPAIASSQSKAGPIPSSSRGSSRTRDSLSEEVAIMGRAETELHSGRAENALILLNEHERRFASGILAEERIAARIQALCALGRSAEANAQLARLSPTSLHGQQARRACGPAPQDVSHQTTGRQSAGSQTNKR